MKYFGIVSTEIQELYYYSPPVKRSAVCVPNAALPPAVICLIIRAGGVVTLKVLLLIAPDSIMPVTGEGLRPHGANAPGDGDITSCGVEAERC